MKLQSTVASIIWALLCTAFTLLTPYHGLADNGEGALDLIPEDATVVIGVDFERLRASGIYEEYRDLVAGQLDADPNIRSLEEAFGGNPFDLMKSGVIAISRDALSKPTDLRRGFVGVVRGDIDKNKFIEWSRREGRPIPTSPEVMAGGAEIYAMPESGEVGFINDFMLIGVDEVRGGLTVLRGEARSLREGPMAQHLGSLKPDRTIWMIATLPERISEDFGGLKSAVVSLDLTDRFTANVALKMTSNQQAEQTRAKLLEFAQAAPANHPLSNVFKGMQIIIQGNAVTVNLSASSEELRVLVNTLVSITQRQ